MGPSRACGWVRVCVCVCVCVCVFVFSSHASLLVGPGGWHTPRRRPEDVISKRRWSSCPLVPCSPGQEAAAAGIAVQQRSLLLGELASLVAGGRHLVIALVDKRALLADPSVRAAVGDAGPGSLGGGRLPPELTLPPGGGYTGHYLLLCGYDAAAAEFSVRDPAAVRPEVRVPAATLEEARKAFGTDEDLLLVEVPAAAASAAAVAGA